MNYIYKKAQISLFGLGFFVAVNNCWAVESIKPLEGTPVVETSTLSRNLSLDIKGMSIVDLLKMISARAGVNIVVGKNVKGQVSMFLKDVDIWDAFEIVLLANDLAYVKEDNGIINVMTKKEFVGTFGQEYKDKKEMEVVTLQNVDAKDLEPTLKMLKSNVGKIIVDDVSNSLVLVDTKEAINRMKKVALNSDVSLETKVFALNYTNVDELSNTIEEQLSTVGKLSLDPVSNKLIVTDTPKYIKKVSKVIDSFDVKPLQVLIDAQIIQLKPSKKFEMGVDWSYWLSKHFQAQTVSGNISVLGRNVLDFNEYIDYEDMINSSTDLLSTAQTIEELAGYATNYVNNLNPLTDSFTERGDYSFFLKALETLGDTKLLSSPRIIALDGQEAKIDVTVKQPFAKPKETTGSEVSSVSYDYETVDIGIVLSVLPQISNDGFISMQIKPVLTSLLGIEEFGESGGVRAAYPVKSESSMETSVVVQDGTTIIVGGLRQDESTKQESRIPIIGNIPLLGKLFTDTSNDNKATDLIILLTPHIISGDGAFTDFKQYKPKNGAVYEMINGELKKNEYSNL